MNLSRIHQDLRKLHSHQDLFEMVVNAPFQHVLHTTELGLGVVVLLLVNKKAGTLDRIALSDTEFARGAVKYSVKPFHEIKIPLTYSKNLLIKAIESHLPQRTEDWRFMFMPVLTAEEARFNQAGAGIASSVIYPLEYKDHEVFGAMIFSYYEPLSNLGPEHDTFMQAYVNIAADTLFKKNAVSSG